MKKLIALVIIIIILTINPSKSNTFNKKYTEGNDIKELNSIEIDEDAKYTKFQENLILGQGKELLSINAKGETKEILKLSKSIENFELDSNSYIDIIDKEDNKVTSIDNDGKTIFTDNVYQETIIHKSINKNIFVTASKDGSKQYLRIKDIDKSLIKEIEYSSKLTHIEYINEKLLVVDLKTDKSIYSELKIYDTNGNLLQSCNFDEIVADIVCAQNSIYIAFEDKVIIFDEELKEKAKIKINGLESIEKDENGKIFVIDSEKKIVCIEKESKKAIKSKPEVVNIESLGEDYITYSDYSIYNMNNKEISKFEGNIKDSIGMDGHTIAVYTGGYMKIIKI